MKTKLILPLLALITLFACDPNDNSGNNGDTLADKIAGDFVGMYQNSSTQIPDYSITVTKISDNEVQFAPTNGSVSATFTATLTEESVGNVTSIAITSPDDILANNGTFVESTGRLSYSFHLGGTDDRNIEVFVGDKQ